MSKVIVIGDSHLRRMEDVFVFPPNFTILAQGGAHVRVRTERKEEIKKHDICKVMLGGKNLLPKPGDPIAYKEEIKNVLGQLTQLRNFCNQHSIRLLIWQVINRVASVDAGFDVIRALNNRLADNKLKLRFRTFSYIEDFISDGVHMKEWWYQEASIDLVKNYDTARVARPDLVKFDLQNVN